MAKANGVRNAAMVFSIAGLLLFIPDIIGHFIRTNSETRAEYSMNKIIAVMATIMCLEDFPQLAIQIAYIDTVGWGTRSDTKAVTVISLVLSVFSIVFNLVTVYFLRKSVFAGSNFASGSSAI